MQVLHQLQPPPELLQRARMRGGWCSSGIRWSWRWWTASVTERLPRSSCGFPQPATLASDPQHTSCTGSHAVACHPATMQHHANHANILPQRPCILLGSI